MKPQLPTCGRIVWYHPPTVTQESIQKENGNGSTDPLPAVIVRVWSDTCVNLKVITDGPVDKWITSATQGDGLGQWNWPAR